MASWLSPLAILSVHVHLSSFLSMEVLAIKVWTSNAPSKASFWFCFIFFIFYFVSREFGRKSLQPIGLRGMDVPCLLALPVQAQGRVDQPYLLAAFCLGFSWFIVSWVLP